MSPSQGRSRSARCTLHLLLLAVLLFLSPVTPQRLWARFPNPTGLAIDRSTNNLYLVSTADYAVYLLDPNATILASYAPPHDTPTNTLLFTLNSVAVDPTSNSIWTSGDSTPFASAVKLSLPSGNATRVARVTRGLRGVAVDGSGRLYGTSADVSQGRGGVGSLYQFTSNGSVLTQFNASRSYNWPGGVTIDREGTVYVCHSTGVLRWSPTGEELSWPGFWPPGGSPKAAAVDPEGQLWMIDGSLAPVVWRLDAKTGAVLAKVTFGYSTGSAYTSGIAVDGRGVAYVSMTDWTVWTFNTSAEWPLPPSSTAPTAPARVGSTGVAGSTGGRPDSGGSASEMGVTWLLLVLMVVVVAAVLVGSAVWWSRRVRARASAAVEGALLGPEYVSMGYPSMQRGAAPPGYPQPGGVYQQPYPTAGMYQPPPQAWGQ